MKGASHMSRLLFTIVLLLSAQGALHCATLVITPEISQNSKTMTGNIMAGGESMHYLEQLTDGIGARLAGSANYDRAAQWAVEQFRAMGIKDVRLEAFTIPHAWQRGEARARMLAPKEQALHVASYGWSPPTPAGGLRAEVVFLDDTSEAAVQTQAAKLKDKI